MILSQNLSLKKNSFQSHQPPQILTMSKSHSDLHTTLWTDQNVFSVRNEFYIPRNPRKHVLHIIMRCFVKNRFFHDSVGGHLGFQLITEFAQSCHSGNQTKFVARPHVNANQQKNFLGNTIARFTKDLDTNIKWTITQKQFGKTKISYSAKICH